MTLQDLLLNKGIDPQGVLVLRHRPKENRLNKVLPWLAAEEPEAFNAYQRIQNDEKVGSAMKRAEHVAAFIGHEPGKALFVGLYAVESWRQITAEEYRRLPESGRLRKFGYEGLTDDSPRSTSLWFDLAPTDFYTDWKGKLVIRWPPPEKNWYRWADRPHNEMPILAILEESAFDSKLPEWDEIDFSWEELRALPSRLRTRLSEWRGIYYIFDTSDGKGYVGSAYGKDNLLGRWLEYAASGHGENHRLRERDPANFRFTILQRVSPDMEAEDVIRLEASWKRRLHTREYGLNEN